MGRPRHKDMRSERRTGKPYRPSPDTDAVMGEPETALAALFQMRGRDAITESDFVFDASMKLRWFTPKEAQRLLQMGVERGLLRLAGGNVEAVFDASRVAVPPNYRPAPDVLMAPPQAADLFARLLVRLQGASGEGPQPIVARINREQERLGVDAEVAAALVAAAQGVDVSDLLPELESEVLRRSR